MAGGISAKLEGVRELSKKLDELSAKASGKILRSAVRYSAKPALDYAKATIPEGDAMHYVDRKIKKGKPGRLVAPGFARRSIRLITRLSKDGRSASAVLGVRRAAFYAVQFVELGTSRTPKQPWLRPALQANQGPILDRLAGKLRKDIQNIARKKGPK